MLAPFYVAEESIYNCGFVIFSANPPASIIALCVYPISIWLMRKNLIFSITSIFSIGFILVLYFYQLLIYGFSDKFTLWFYLSFSFSILTLISTLGLSIHIFIKRKNQDNLSLLKTIKNHYIQTLCTSLFIIGLLIMIAPFFSVEGIKTIDGLLIITANLPYSMIAIWAYLISIWLMNKKPILSIIASFISVGYLLSLYIIQLAEWGGTSDLITLWFYFSFVFMVSALILALILSIHILKKKTNN